MKKQPFVKNNKLYLGSGKQKGGGFGLLGLGLGLIPVLKKAFGSSIRRRRRRRRRTRRW